LQNHQFTVEQSLAKNMARLDKKKAFRQRAHAFSCSFQFLWLTVKKQGTTPQNSVVPCFYLSG
jgi:hypothetical protein